MPEGRLIYTFYISFFILFSSSRGGAKVDKGQIQRFCYSFLLLSMKNRHFVKRTEQKMVGVFVEKSVDKPLLRVRGREGETAGRGVFHRFKHNSSTKYKHC